MISSEGRKQKAADLLVVLRSRGIKVWRDSGGLRYQAPRGLLTQDDLEKLGEMKADLIELLRQLSSDEVVEQQIAPRLPSDRVPLTFSQQLWWSCLQLEKRPSTRSIAGALRLTGPLNVVFLQKCFSDLVRRHESLRTRIVVAEGVPRQVIDEPIEYQLDVSDLSRLSNGEQIGGITKLLERIIYEPVPVEAGPLFATSLVKLSDEGHVLIVAMDHIISDVASLGIVWHEIFTMYGQSVRGLPCSPPNTSVQFADYAVWQQRTNQNWVKQHDAYWKKRLIAGKRLRPLGRDAMQEGIHVSWKRQPIRFGEGLSKRLRALGRENKTSCAIVTLASYMAFLLRWCDVAELIVAFISIGRHHAEVEKTIGYFGGPLYLRVETAEGDRFLDLLTRVTREYSIAYEHSDCGRVAAGKPTPEFAWNPRFNWIPEELNTSNYDINGLESNISLKVEPYRLEDLAGSNIEWDGDLEMVASEGSDGLSGFLVYRTDRFAAQSIERFARSFELFTEQLVRQPGAPLPISSLAPER